MPFRPILVRQYYRLFVSALRFFKAFIHVCVPGLLFLQYIVDIFRVNRHAFVLFAVHNKLVRSIETGKFNHTHALLNAGLKSPG